MPMNSHVTTVVRNVVYETPSIARFELTCPDFWDLPRFTAGAHIDVVLPDGAERQYSLCSDPADGRRYQIAVLLDEHGRGGSATIHRLVRVGSVVSVSMPRNLFAVSPHAARHIFIAGGIGITPFIAMVLELERRGGEYELHYCTRSREDIAFFSMLNPRTARGTVHFHNNTNGRLDMEALLVHRQPGEHVYCCGPSRMLNDFLEATRGWPAEAVHYERFGKDPTAASSAPYRVLLGRSGQRIEVAANQTLAAALMAHGAPVKVACEAGVCGTCKVQYLSGSPIHRDLILSADDRQVLMTPCVSSCVDDELVLNL